MDRLAVSNIAWALAEETAALDILRTHSVRGVEVAPTVVWPDWKGATAQAAAVYRAQLADIGLFCPALQAVLYGRPALQLFGSAEQRQGLDLHLRLVGKLAAALGAGVVVFGSPLNRRRGQLPPEEAMMSAAAFFRPLAPYYDSLGVTLAIEANPTVYGSDFIITLAEARELVGIVDQQGFGLHLDAGGMTLEGEDPGTAAAEACHFHMSQPRLEDFSDPAPAHRDFADQLRRVGYSGWVSIEMRSSGLDKLEEAVRFARAVYGGENDG